MSDGLSNPSKLQGFRARRRLDEMARLLRRARESADGAKALIRQSGGPQWSREWAVYCCAKWAASHALQYREMAPAGVSL